MSTARDPCPNCQLPFYTDRNEHCPYCGSTPGTTTMDSAGPAADEPESTAETSSVDSTPAGSVRRDRPPSRPRTTCSQCGLAHYADDDGGCPYCSAAAVGSAKSGAADTSADTDPESTGPTASRRESDDRTARQGSESGGFLSRLLEMFGR